MPQKSLIIAFLVLFTASASFLFWRNEHELDPDQGKSWWTLSFATPEQTDSLSFSVENHSDSTRFDYKIVADKKVLTAESFIVEKGKPIRITPEFSAQPDTRTSVIVTDGTGKKEIYR
jgi:hypothetical protein